MLVIRRHAGQSILVGDNIEIQIIEISPTRVKIGIIAPQEIPIIRKEVQLTSEENRRAAGASSASRLAPFLARFR